MEFYESTSKGIGPFVVRIWTGIAKSVLKFGEMDPNVPRWAPMGTWKAIAAMAENRVIGSGQRIPWRLPADFAWFKRTTMGGVLVMGRKTFTSIGRPLPGRETIVLSRTGFAFPGVKTAANGAELDRLVADTDKTVWIVGGAEIYREFLARCSELFLTCVPGCPVGDAFFPSFEDQFIEIAVVLEQPEFVVRHYHHRARLLA